jgi:hypothetical protein
MKWKILPIPTDDTQAHDDAVRLNSIGSLFFFALHVLKKTRLAKLHWQMARSLEVEDLRLVLEEPVGHFKTTMGISLSMWWALPFTPRDEYMMRQLGYDDTWIRWMQVAHNPNTRTMYTHEIEDRAIAMGKEIDGHYQSNDLFRRVFKDILPDNSCTWDGHSKFQKRVRNGSDIDATTGTFEYRGVGQAIQGIHPDRTIQDDNMGKAALDSILKGDGRVLEGLIRWHRQLTTRLDSVRFTAKGNGGQLVIGNRWGHQDLNSWIRENQPEFKFETHSAEGGCCILHPYGTPIFPEEWTMERLAQKRAILGNYDYAHQYLNQSVLPEECIFKPEWLRWYNFAEARPDLDAADVRNYLMIEPEVRDGETQEPINAGVLHKRMIVDLAHAKKHRRCDHVILVVGFDPEKDRIHILDCWAEPSGYDSLVDNIYLIGHKWGMRDMWLETVAAQNLMKFHIEQRNRNESRPIFVNELKYDNSENAKTNRIEALVPILKNGQIWLPRVGKHAGISKLVQEYNSYPAGLKDILDVLGYVPETLENIRRAETMEYVQYQQQEFNSRSVGRGGY